ncbi:Protein NtpR [Tritrichomonas foetus]|uniref:Protein NtpR n=1 Tax=Tritrichomonas foetus TaxID=1144522 RepID=A0A1J4KL88_9EUKA|nr:Protein NtpR [Tritrichomonas foetus]|eukprot:OHT10462.1 Protein NtpR [Tritrichomonas foetus]
MNLLSLFFSFSFSRKPLIGICSTYDTENTQIYHDYPLSVIRGGGLPVIIPLNDDAETISGIVSKLDAVIMPGGPDLDPLLYGEEPLNNLGAVHCELDKFQFMVLDSAINYSLPIFGICRGLQLMNVYFGGTLYQDLPSQNYTIAEKVLHQQTNAKKYESHSVSITDGSILKTLLQKNDIRVNSLHHQAIKDVAPGFKVTAIARDGVVEAIEKPNSDPPIFAVQWHPEAITCKGIDTFLPLFQYFVEVALKSSEKKIDNNIL